MSVMPPCEPGTRDVHQPLPDDVSVDRGPPIAIANATVAADYGVLEAHVLIEGRKIAAIIDATDPVPAADEPIDASGCVVLPGAIDTHTHLEDPGHTEREDFTTGTMAAAAGGVTPVTVDPVSAARAHGQVATAEVCGHHLLLDAAEQDTFADARPVSTYHHSAVKEPFSSAGRTGQAKGGDRGG